MIYLAGLGGLLAGFMIGQLLLLRLLRGRSREDILTLMADRGTKFKYGLMNWGFALLGAWGAATLYRFYFPG